MTVIYSVFTFVIVILVHEFGHFALAKLNNIKVNEFSIGMGPQLLSKEGSETKYTLRALPIGGYVALDGEEEESDDPRSFNNAHPLKRISVLVAGAMMNFLLAILLFSIVFSITGSPSLIIEEVIADSPADEANIKAGDKLISIDGEKLNEWNDISSNLNKNKSEDVTIELERDNKLIEIKAYPKVENGNYSLGITSKNIKNFGSALTNGFNYTKIVVLGVYKFIGQLVTGQMSISNLSGPVGIIRMIGTSSQEGFLNVIMVAAMISANLGGFNLLPFPALDGGTILITFIEMIIGRDVPEKIKIGLNLVGLGLLLSLILYVTIFNDILNPNRIG